MLRQNFQIIDRFIAAAVISRSFGAKWGKSFAVRILQHLAKEINLIEGCRVQLVGGKTRFLRLFGLLVAGNWVFQIVGEPAPRENYFYGDFLKGDRMSGLFDIS
ncbi:MAG: hypothetical protein WBA89_12875 [Microcoleus sp.]|uniref:hypothetical protein n=1 Tax=Microcoleus sp. TaxID=44472 RepID=UPI003C72F43D